MSYVIFFFSAPATTEIYTYCHTLSLHGALPICSGRLHGDPSGAFEPMPPAQAIEAPAAAPAHDRRGLLTAALRLAARSEEHTSALQSLMRISYAVFCLIKKIHNNQ